MALIKIEKKLKKKLDDFSFFKQESIKFRGMKQEVNVYITKEDKNSKFKDDLTLFDEHQILILLIEVKEFTNIIVSKEVIDYCLDLIKKKKIEIFLLFTLHFDIIKTKLINQGKNPTLQDICRYIEINEESSVKLFKSKSLYTNKAFSEETNIKINSLSKIRITKLKKGFPLSRRSEQNLLNDLSSRDWLKFTKSWFILNPPPRKTNEILHPAKYPEELVERYLLFFTKRGQIVFDPFLGVGSTIIAALKNNRIGYGFELNSKYYKIALNRCKSQGNNLLLDQYIEQKKDSKQKGVLLNKKNTRFKIWNEDSRKIHEIWISENLPKIDLCITSPPYWNQLERNTLRQVERKKKGLDTKYSEIENDLGNIKDYNNFLQEQQEIFKKVYEITKNNGYLIIITNNVYVNDEMYPLAFETLISMRNIGWIPLDEQIWCQDNKSLKPFGIFKKYMANRTHQYVLIFQKGEKRKT